MAESGKDSGSEGRTSRTSAIATTILAMRDDDDRTMVEHSKSEVVE
jgi:hypothetical protein